MLKTPRCYLRCQSKWGKERRILCLPRESEKTSITLQLSTEISAKNARINEETIPGTWTRNEAIEDNGLIEETVIPGTEFVVDEVVDKTLEDCIDVSMYSDYEDNVELHGDANDNSNKEPREDSNNELLHEDFLCNVCNSTISGFRYTCVQCLDYDLCSSCEARGEHCLHYVLRIPRPKPLGEIKSLLDSVRTNLIVLNCAPEQVNVLDINDIKSEIEDEEDDPFLTDPFLDDVDDNIENNVPGLPGDPLIAGTDTIEFVDAFDSTNNEKMPLDNPIDPKIAGSQNQITNTMKLKPIILNNRNDKILQKTETDNVEVVDAFASTISNNMPLDNPNEPKISGSQQQINSMKLKPIILNSRCDKIPPPPSSVYKPEDAIKIEMFADAFASTNNKNIPLDNPNQAKMAAGSQHQITNTMMIKPIILKTRNDKIPPPPSSVRKPEDAIKTESKTAELVQTIVHTSQTTQPRGRHKPVVSQTDYKKLLKIAPKPANIKVISKQGTVGCKSATDRVIHVFTMAKHLKKKKIEQDVRQNVIRLSKEEIKAVMKTVR